MHLYNIEIERFRAIKKLSLPLVDARDRIKPITVIAGPNGSGKTSLVLAIAQALRGVMGVNLPDIPYPGKQDVYRDEPAGRVPVRATVELGVEFGQEELKSISKVLAREQSRSLLSQVRKPPPALVAGRMVGTWYYPQPEGEARDPGFQYSTDYLHPSPKGAGYWLTGAKVGWRQYTSREAEFRDIESIGMLRVFPQDRDARLGLDAESSKLSDDPAADSNEFEEPLGFSSRLLDPSSAPRRSPTVRESLRRLGEWAQGKLPPNDVRRGWERELQKRFSEICHPKEYLGYWLDHPLYGETPLLKDGTREYPFSAAASGEHIILHYLTKFTFPRPTNNGLILIDEPELHLHPTWIRQLYRALPLLGENNQFIMTTHSPELRQIAAEEGCLIDLGRLGDIATPPPDAERAALRV